MVYPPLWKIWKSDWIIILTIGENKNMFQTTNHQVAGASGAWRFYSVSASKRLFSTLLAVVGVVVFHQLCQLFQHDQWCTSLEITSPHILETTTSQRWIHLWPHQSLHFSVKIGKNKFLQTQPLSVDLLRASDFRQLGTVDVSEQAAKLFVSVIPPMPMNVITSPPIPPSQST